MKSPAQIHYSLAQRGVALLYGIACHASFAVAVAGMAWSFYHGMTSGLGLHKGFAAVSANAALLLQFPIFHSWLLSTRGRRFLGRLAPLGLGQELSTTTFAIVSSLQLTATFLLWSPSGVVWWHAHGWEHWAMLVPFAGAWLLLLKSMNDSQLSLQTGFLGWGAVVRNRKPRYESFPTQGTYRYCRQPIYLSFALILWAGSTWTPDQLVLAVAWTAYCVVGSALKEQRFVRYFGDAFREYQLRVPFWIPSFARARHLRGPISSIQADAARPECDVLIVGGGPVGFLLANLLGARGVRTLLVEQRTEPPAGSMAIGVTPPSLQIVKQLGLDDAFCRAGLPISSAKVHEAGDLLGRVDFSHLPSDYRFILSLPQSKTVRLLEANVHQFRSVNYYRGLEFVSLKQHARSATVLMREAITGIEMEFCARYVVGCDGHRSAVRRAVGIPAREKTYRQRFVMADFEDRSGLGDEAHLFFSARASVESFPLPGNRRRWIVLSDKETEPDPAGYLIATVRRLAGYELGDCPRHFLSTFLTRRSVAQRYHRGRVLLCGDAAHVMSSIGGQGMNTGFADAELLAEVLGQVLETPQIEAERFALYDRVRRKAFTVAADRAERGMWLGTQRGALASTLRKHFIRGVLFRTGMKHKLAPYFAMLTIPFNTAARVPTVTRAVHA